MTNQANYIPITYRCNGVTKNFAFSWKIFQNDDLVVELIEVATGEVKVLEKNKYTVDFGDMGGSIRTVETYSTDYQLKISRNIPLFQNKSFTTSSGFQATEIEKALDKTSCQMQDLVYNEGQFEIKTGVVIEEFKDEVIVFVDGIKETADVAVETANDTKNTLNNFLDDPNAKTVSEIEAVIKNQIITSQEITDTILNAQEAREIATSANETSNEAKETANNANETSQEALSIAQTAGLTPKGEYNSSTIYRRNDFIYRTTSTETTYYISKQDGNVGNPVTDTTYWALFMTQVVGESIQWGNIVGNILGQKDLMEKFEDVNERINSLETAKSPNATPIGNLNIEGSFVSGFSENDYYQFPFIDISHGMPFELYFSFTTGADVTTQQNILDSYFGIALAIQNGKGIMALSSNGSSWDIGLANGTQTLTTNTTYYAKIAWTGTQYTTALSTDGETYNPDMILNSSLSPHKTTIYIGASPNIFGAGTSHPFKGTINFNGAKVIVNGNVEWDGYADVGFQTRADISLSNIDSAGEDKIKIVAETNSKQDKLIEGNNISIVDNVISASSGISKQTKVVPMSQEVIEDGGQSSLPASDFWSSVTYGNGKFVAVITTSNISAYSTDGKTWTASTLPSSAKWVSVAYGNGVFVAIGGTTKSSVVAYSTDGVNWTSTHFSHTTSTAYDYTAVTYGNDKFVAINESATAEYSTDGITWHRCTLPSSKSWSSITYGNDKFVAIASGGTVGAYSLDGVTWTASTLPNSANSTSVTYGNGKFVAVGLSSTGSSGNTSIYSTDGITWKASTLPSSASWLSVTYGNGKFVAIASGGTVGAYSLDGVTWKSTTLPVSQAWVSVAYGNGKFVAVANDSSKGGYSTNGTNWRTQVIGDVANIVLEDTVSVYKMDIVNNTWLRVNNSQVSESESYEFDLLMNIPERKSITLPDNFNVSTNYPITIDSAGKYEANVKTYDSGETYLVKATGKWA